MNAPNTITFMRNAAEKVMTISRDGVWVNPNVPVDEAAAAVIAALDQHIKALVKREETQRDELLKLLIRYRNETPLGNQPHMIAHLVDEAIAKAKGE